MAGVNYCVAMMAEAQFRWKTQVLFLLIVKFDTTMERTLKALGFYPDHFIGQVGIFIRSSSFLIDLILVSHACESRNMVPTNIFGK